MITGPNTGLRDYLPGASGQKLILFSGAPNLIVTLSPPFALAIKSIIKSFNKSLQRTAKNAAAEFSRYLY